jgi:CHAT domain-containing protein
LVSYGALTARRIAKLILRPDQHHPLRKRPIVVMSACDTALGKSFESGVNGLAKAWKYAGARAVVMSLWKVLDKPTKDLMVEFMTGLVRRGNPPDLALRNAMLKMRDDPKWAHPIYWLGLPYMAAPTSGWNYEPLQPGL